MSIFASPLGSCCSLQVCRKGPEQNRELDTIQSDKPIDVAKNGSPDPSRARLSGNGKADAPPETMSPSKKIEKVPSAKSIPGVEQGDAVSEASAANSHRSYRSSTSSVGTEYINEHIPAHQREVAKIQAQMKAFVKGMVKGREMNVLSVDGQLRQCTCSFDRKLRNYKIQIVKDTRAIPLASFKEVFQGTEPENIETPLDALCATIELNGGECLSFRFKDEAERENFAICLQTIMDGHQ